MSERFIITCIVVSYVLLWAITIWMSTGGRS